MKEKDNDHTLMVRYVVFAMLLILGCCVYLQSKRIDALMEKMELLEHRKLVIEHIYQNN